MAGCRACGPANSRGSGFADRSVPGRPRKLRIARPASRRAPLCTRSRESRAAAVPWARRPSRARSDARRRRFSRCRRRWPETVRQARKPENDQRNRDSRSASASRPLDWNQEDPIHPVGLEFGDRQPLSVWRPGYRWEWVTSWLEVSQLALRPAQGRDQIDAWPGRPVPARTRSGGRQATTPGLCPAPDPW